MKKLYTSIVALSCAAASFGQLTNLGLESWTAGTGYNNPDGWFTINEFASQIFISPPVVRESTNPAEGLYSASMSTRYCAICGTIGVPIDTIPGLLQQQNAISVSPLSVNFKYKYQGVNGDNGGALIELTKWDTLSLSQELIGEGFYQISSNSTTWQDAVATITYASSDLPDSITITFVSSLRAATFDDQFPPSGINSKLTVDAISVSMPASINTIENELEASVTLINNQIQIIAEGLNGALYEIFTLSGQKIMSATINNTTTLVNTNEMASGVYLVKISNQNGTATKKVALSK